MAFIIWSLQVLALSRMFLVLFLHSFASQSKQSSSHGKPIIASRGPIALRNMAHSKKGNLQRLGSTSEYSSYAECDGGY